MSTTQRARYLDLYRSKLHKELDQMHYNRIHKNLTVATVSQPSRPLTAGAAAITVLLIAGFTMGQTL